MIRVSRTATSPHRGHRGPSRVGHVFRRLTASCLLAAVVLAGCGADTDAQDPAAAAEAPTETGVRVVDAEAAFAITENPPAGLTVIDVRTPEEFAEGHLADATLIDISSDTFMQDLEALERDTPYLIYCRSGNRSEQARLAMADLGFSDVADLEGGILAWQAAGYPTAQ